MTDNLSWTARLLLWDYARGSMPYDILCVILVVLMALLPPAILGDPMRMGP